MGDKFFLGTCSNCRQRAEVHEGADGLAYCEDCLVMCGKDSESQKKTRLLPSASNPNTDDRISIEHKVTIPNVAQSSKRNELIDWIVSNADEKWLDKFLASCKENYAWVSLLEQESNERILLRLATELGYATQTKEFFSISPEKIPLLETLRFKPDVKAKKNRPNKRNRGRPSGSSHRVGATQEGKSVSLSNP